MMIEATDTRLPGGTTVGHLSVRARWKPIPGEIHHSGPSWPPVILAPSSPCRARVLIQGTPGITCGERVWSSYIPTRDSRLETRARYLRRDRCAVGRLLRRSRALEAAIAESILAVVESVDGDAIRIAERQARQYRGY
jgi:hypothetical protein